MSYSPTSMTTATSGINHLAAIYYDDAAVANFKAHLPFYEACDTRTLPNRKGKTIQFFTYNLFSANTTPGSEGTVGTGIAASTSNINVSVNQYTDFVTFADFLVDTAIDPIVENTAAELGYRAALTVNTLISAAFDVAVAADASANIAVPHGSFMSRAAAEQAVFSLRAKNVRPKDDGDFYGIIHPLAAFDLWNDNSNGGTIDWEKHVQSGVDKFHRGVQGFKVAQIAGCTWIETTTTPTATINSNVNYSSYVVGKDAIMAVSLGAIEVPKDEKNFYLAIKNKLAPSAADPAGVIGAMASYNFVFGVVQRPGTVMGLRRIQSEVSIA